MCVKEDFASKVSHAGACVVDVVDPRTTGL